MFVLHFNGKVQSFPTLRNAVNYLADISRHAVRPQGVYIVDTKATENYTTPHPSSKKKPAVFVRANPLANSYATDFVKIASDETFFTRPIDCSVVASPESLLRIAKS